jgi:hypothetical protein
MAVIVVVPREEIQGINDFFNTILMLFVVENFIRLRSISADQNRSKSNRINRIYQ